VTQSLTLGTRSLKEGKVPTPLRIATFNCENLFSRPKVFDQSAKKSNEILGYVADLTAALHEDVYDHAKIADLEKKSAVSRA
jgi:hypothetical protein